MDYHWKILSWARLAIVSLLSVTGVTGHAAIWDGASNPQVTRWVQAGIELTPDVDNGQKMAYIEAARGDVPFLFTSWPASARERVHLVTRDGRYQVRIDGHSSPWVWIPHAKTMVVKEILGPGTAKVRVSTP